MVYVQEVGSAWGVCLWGGGLHPGGSGESAPRGCTCLSVYRGRGVVYVQEGGSASGAGVCLQEGVVNLHPGGLLVGGGLPRGVYLGGLNPGGSASGGLCI